MPSQLSKSHSLTGLIDLDRMRRAFLAVKRNRGAAGVDKVSLRAFEANLDDNLAALLFDLKHDDRYHSSPLRRVFIPKGDGKLRPLGIPSVRDRVAQEVVRSLLEPFFEPHFSEFSFGFRFVRYADDFVVLCRSHSQAKQALAFVDTFLRVELGLSLSLNKTKVVSFVKGFDFLGFHVSKRRISIRAKSIEKLKARVRMLTTRSHNLCPEVFRELNRVFIGYAHYFAAPFASVADQFRLLDHWVRARIRSMKFKGISRGYNRRWTNKLISRLGLVSLYGLLT